MHLQADPEHPNHLPLSSVPSARVIKLPLLLPHLAAGPTAGGTPGPPAAAP